VLIHTFSNIHELVSWAWSYPVPWVWIGWGIVTLVGLIGAAGVIIGLKMKQQDRKNGKGPIKVGCFCACPSQLLAAATRRNPTLDMRLTKGEESWPRSLLWINSKSS
jgi:hypothetical protein